MSRITENSFEIDRKDLIELPDIKLSGEDLAILINMSADKALETLQAIAVLLTLMDGKFEGKKALKITTNDAYRKVFLDDEGFSVSGYAAFRILYLNGLIAYEPGEKEIMNEDFFNYVFAELPNYMSMEMASTLMNQEIAE